MSQYIETPEGVAEFPDDMSPDQITAVLQKQFGAPPEPRSLSEKVFRGLGLGARYLTETPGLMVAGLSDVVAKGINLGLEARGAPPGTYRLPENRAERVREGFTAMGFPESEGELEQFGERISRGTVGLAMGMGAGQQLAGAASPVTQAVGRTLTESPGLQAVSLASGETAGTVAEKAGAGPGGQLAARLGGAMLPSAALATGSAAVRGGFRGKNPVAETIDDFARVGTKPTVGQATQGRAARATESLLSRTPGGAGRMAKTAEQQSDDVAREIERKARTLAGKTSAERAGRVIESKIRGPFMAKFRATQQRLYNELDNWIDPSSRIAVTKTASALDDMTKTIPGAEATSARMVKPGLKSIADDFATDAADGQLPFEALKQLRTRVGEKLNTVDLTDDVTRQQWKRLYGALSDDLEAAARATKNPQAMQAWSRANTYTRAGHNRLEIVENVIRKKGGPEKIFNAATSGTKEGATTLRSVMQSLDDEGQKVVSATVLRRMGLANPSAQNEAGNLFSTNTFLTRWNQLSNEAKRTLFDRYGPGFRRDMNAVAKYAANLREGSQVFINPSGTAQAAAQYTTAGAFIMSVLTGNVGAASAIAGGVVGANRLAALMTNPQFVKWLAQTTAMRPAALPAQIAILENQAIETGDEDLAFAATLLQESQQNQPQQDQRRAEGQ